MSEIDFFSSLSKDRQTALFEVEDNGKVISSKFMKADEIDILIQTLGRLRSKMLPIITQKLEQNPVFGNVTRETIFHVNRQNVVSKEFFIAARHESFGWLAFTVSNENGSILANLILRQIEANTPKIIAPNSGLII